MYLTLALTETQRPTWPATPLQIAPSRKEIAVKTAMVSLQRLL